MPSYKNPLRSSNSHKNPRHDPHQNRGQATTQSPQHNTQQCLTEEKTASLLRQTLQEHAATVTPSEEAFFAIHRRVRQAEQRQGWRVPFLPGRMAERVRLQPSMIVSLVLLIALSIVTTLLITQNNDTPQTVEVASPTPADSAQGSNINPSGNEGAPGGPPASVAGGENAGNSNATGNHSVVSDGENLQQSASPVRTGSRQGEPSDPSLVAGLEPTSNQLIAPGFEVRPLQVASNGAPVIYAQHRTTSEQIGVIPVVLSDTISDTVKPESEEPESAEPKPEEAELGDLDPVNTDPANANLAEPDSAEPDEVEPYLSTGKRAADNLGQLWIEITTPGRETGDSQTGWVQMKTVTLQPVEPNIQDLGRVADVLVRIASLGESLRAEGIEKLVESITAVPDSLAESAEAEAESGAETGDAAGSDTNSDTGSEGRDTDSDTDSEETATETSPAVDSEIRAKQVELDQNIKFFQQLVASRGMYLVAELDGMSAYTRYPVDRFLGAFLGIDPVEQDSPIFNWLRLCLANSPEAVPTSQIIPPSASDITIPTALQTLTSISLQGNIDGNIDSGNNNSNINSNSTNAGNTGHIDINSGECEALIHFDFQQGSPQVIAISVHE